MAEFKLVNSEQLNADLLSIANAIRTKGNTSSPLSFPTEFVEAIMAIATYLGGKYNILSVSTGPNRQQLQITDADRTLSIEELNVTENGTYTAPIDTAYSPVKVNVPTGDVDIEEIDITANGTYTAPSGTAYNPINVNVPDGTNIEELEVTENGTYTAPSGTAYSPVIVDIPSEEIDVEEIDITANGTYTAPSGKAYSPINVNVPSESVDIEALNVDAGGTYTAPSGKAYSPVNVPTGSAATPTTAKQQSAPVFSVNNNVVTANIPATYIDVTPDVEEGYVSSGVTGRINMTSNSGSYTFPIGSVSVPATTKQQSTPTFSLSGNVLTVNVPATYVDIIPNVIAGYVSSGLSGRVSMSSNSTTYNIPTYSGSISVG